MPFDAVLGPSGLFLLYGAPGLGVAAAVFPEKFRWRPQLEDVVELAVLAVVVSVAVTILFGSALAATPNGFASTWASPALLVGDGAVAVVGGLVGVGRRVAGVVPAPPELASPDAGGWATLRSLEAMAREERRITRALRRTSGEGPERSALEARLRDLKAERESLRKSREAEFAT
ncbi:MAG TPA: hypothetical protein VMH90_03865 [Thermoplasmata archaeon]|nr:hypothetical protein [Thermoplasmata archaeon]